MAIPRPKAERSARPSEWELKRRWAAAAICAATLLLAAAALSNAVGNTFDRINPILAAWQFGADANIPLKAEMQAYPKAELGRLEKTARKALVRKALNPLALTALGLTTSGRGGNAEPYMLASDMLSRRESWAQFWLLEHSVQAENIPDALNRYDILMSLKSDYWTVLFPILDEALDTPEIAREFASHLRLRRTWTGGFFDYMLTRSSEPRRLARLVLISGGVDHARSLGLDVRPLFEQLAQSGNASLLQALFLSTTGTDRTMLQSVAFSASAFDQALVPVTWELPASTNATAVPERRGDETVLRIVASSDATARALRKFVFLAPGRYRMTFNVEPVRLGEEATAGWEANCVSGDEEPQLTPINLSRSGLGQAMFVVPMGCPAVALTLDVNGGTDQQGLEFLLGSPRLDRSQS